MLIRILRPLTILYLLVPALFFSVGWLRPPFEIVDVGLLLAFSWWQIRSLLQARFERNVRRVVWSGWPLAAVIFLGWVLLSGTGGFGFQVKDYIASNALLRDLIVHPWPLTITMNGETSKYVYYVGYFLPAAAIGKLLGWTAANYFLLAWTYAGVLLSFAWFARFVNIGEQHLGLLAIFFCLAGGLDLLGHLFFQNLSVPISAVVEWWAGYFQYSSNTTLLFWVPQQAIPGWLLTSLVLDMFAQREASRALGIVIAVGLLWTPLALIGLLPFCALLIYEHRTMRPDISWWWANLAGLWLAVIHALYIASNQFDFPKGFIGSARAGGGMQALKYLPVFWVLEFALLGGLAAWVFIYASVRLSVSERLNATQSRWLGLSLAVLFLLPLIKFGVHNDIVMRGSIPALFILWAIVAKLIFMISSESRRMSRPVWIIAIALVIIGSYPAIYGIKLSVQKYHVGPPNLAQVSESQDANSRQIVMQRLGSADSFFYQYIGK